MELFKNKVGRPSNETLKNRRIVATVMIFAMVLAIGCCVFYTVNHFKYGSVEGVEKNINSSNLAKVFSDSILRKCVLDAYNKQYKKSKSDLTLSELGKIKNVSCHDPTGSNNRILSTKGIETLKGLKYFTLHSDEVTSIDLSKNTKLVVLSLSADKISSLDLSKNTKLTYLGLSPSTPPTILPYNDPYIPISSLDLSKNTKLTSLSILSSKIKSLDLSKNTKLTELDLMDNPISSINLSKNNKLTKLYLNYDEIKSIDLSKNTKLTKLDLSNNAISSINLSKNTKLTELDLSNNAISSINLSKNTKLTKLNLSNNEIKSIDLSNNKKIYTLQILKGNPIKKANIKVANGVYLDNILEG